MKQKLIEIYESLNKENREQLFDYATMLWEMEQGENQLKNQLGINLNISEYNIPPSIDKSDPKNIN